MLERLTDPRDRVLLEATPTLMQPLFGELPPVPMHRHRFVIARDGVYLQARTPGLVVCLRVSGKHVCEFPYGRLEESVVMPGGPLPADLVEALYAHAVTAAPQEWACAILYDPTERRYRLHIPETESVSQRHIRYRTTGYDAEQLVFDVHTHGDGPAFFSGTDDISDRQGGIYIAIVLGRCGTANTLTATARIVVDGIFYPVPWVPLAGLHSTEPL